MTEFYSGSISCVVSAGIYHVSHNALNLLYSHPVVSLVAPTSSANLFVQGILNRTTTGFDIVLSSVPVVSGYEINWQINIPGTGPNEYINDRRYFSKEEIAHAKLSRVHWRNVIAAPDLSPKGLQNSHNHNNLYYTKSEIPNVVNAQIDEWGSYTQLADTLMLRNAEGRCQVNTPKVVLDAANKGYTDARDNYETTQRIAADLVLQSQITAISGSYTPLTTTAQLQAQVDLLNTMMMSITGNRFYGGGAVPVGTIISFGSATPPGIDWILANGAFLSVTGNAELFSVYGYTFGGSGAFFQIPDLRGEFIRGWDAARGVDSGRVFGSTQAEDNKAHDHSTTVNLAGSHSHTITINSNGSHTHALTPALVTDTGTAHDGPDATSDGDHVSQTGSAGNHNHTATIDAAGGHNHSVTLSSEGSESRPRNVALNYYIKLFTPEQIIPVDATSTQTISGQKTFLTSTILPAIPQALIFGDPTATGTLALGIIGGQMWVTQHTSAGPWVPVTLIV
jgi:microcystin-dependent protein